jgi:hypothetical protein
MHKPKTITINTMPLTKESKYGKKTSFSREKQYARSEAEIEHVSNNLDEWKQVRKQEREKNLRIASGKPVIDEPAINEYGINERSTKEDVNEPTTYYAKMNFVLHDIPLSYNIDNVLRSFQYFGKVQYVRSRMNAETSTYTVTIVADEWEETIKDIQADIFNKGFAIMDKYKITADATQPVNEYGEKIETDE